MSSAENDKLLNILSSIFQNTDKINDKHTFEIEINDNNKEIILNATTEYPQYFQTSNNRLSVDRSEINRDFEFSIYFNRTHFLELAYEKYQTENIYIFELSENTLLNKDSDNNFIRAYNNYLKLKEIIIPLAYHKDSIKKYKFSNGNNAFFNLNIEKAFIIENSKEIDRFFTESNSYKEAENKHSKEYHLILKSTFIQFCERNHDNTLKSICENFDSFYLELTNNYSLYLNDFSFEKLKNTFIQEKQKYIELLDKYLGTVVNFIISLPVTMGINILSKILNTKPAAETSTYSLFFFISLIVYAVSSIIVLWINNRSLKITELIINSEKKKIESVTVNSEDINFQNIFKLFKSKIRLTKCLTIMTICILAFLALYSLIEVSCLLGTVIASFNTTIFEA